MQRHRGLVRRQAVNVRRAPATHRRVKPSPFTCLIGILLFARSTSGPSNSVMGTRADGIVVGGHGAVTGLLTILATTSRFLAGGIFFLGRFRSSIPADIRRFVPRPTHTRTNTEADIETLPPPLRYVPAQRYSTAAHLVTIRTTCYLPLRTCTRSGKSRVPPTPSSRASDA